MYDTRTAIEAGLAAIEAAIAAAPAEERWVAWNRVRDAVAEASGQRRQPVSRVLFVPVSAITSNDWNPNSVATNEMRLLHTSIAADGFTQPIVTIWDPEIAKWVIIDGFHRYTTGLRDGTLLVDGLLPIVVLDKEINDRMASTVRHNRARGKHSIKGMASMVFKMLDEGWSDAHICAELGMEADELVRLKFTTGFARLFEDVKYQNEWMTRKQIKMKKEYELQHGGE